MAYEPAKPDYYDLLNKFACLGPVSAGLPVTETLKKAGLVETTTTITASGRALLKNEARRLRPVPPEPSAGTVEYLAGCDKAIRNASGAVVTPSVWAEMLRDAKVCMLVEGGAVHDLVTWADSGEEVRKVRPELRVRLTELGLQAVGRWEAQRDAERRSADRVLALVQKANVSEAVEPPKDAA